MPLSSAFSPQSPLVLIGAGKMGGALIGRWLDRGLDRTAFVVVDPQPRADSVALLAALDIAARPTPPPDLKAKVIVVAVKPQIIGAVLPGLTGLIGADTVTLSIVAGATLSKLRAPLGDTAIVRSMPNTPARIGRGVTAAIASPKVDAAARALIAELLEALGEVIWVDDEDLIDAATAVSGSGPAYVFLLAECLAEAALAVGFDKDAAQRLARATVTGAGALLHQSALSPEELRRMVTSPEGTTAAALEILMADNGLAPLIGKAVAAAKKRSRQLSVPPDTLPV